MQPYCEKQNASELVLGFSEYLYDIVGGNEEMDLFFHGEWDILWFLSSDLCSIKDFFICIYLYK